MYLDLDALMAGPGTLAPSWQSSGPGVEGLMRALRELIRENEQREKRAGEEARARSYGSTLGGASGLQQAYVGTRRSPEQRLSAAGTVQLVNRQKSLRAAGLPESGPWVSNPRPDETEGEYIERMQRAYAAHEQRRQAVADRNRAASAEQRLAAAREGRVPRAVMIAAVGDEPDRFQRAIRQRDLVQGRAGIETRDDEALFEQGLKTHLLGPMPAYQPEGYRSRVAVGPLESRLEDPDVDRLRLRTRAEEERLLRALAQMQALGASLG